MGNGKTKTKYDFLKHEGALDIWGKEIDIDSIYDKPDYFQGWQAADRYAWLVINNKIITGEWTKLAIKRYIRDRQRDDLEFDTETINRVIMLANGLCHNRGVLAGKPIKLLPWMIFVLANIYGFRYKQSGKLRFVKTLLFVARANAKSMLMSVIAAFELLNPSSGDSNIISVARQRDQARICFDDCWSYISRGHPSIRDHFTKKQFELSVGGSRFRPMASEARSLDGTRIQCGIVDELHANKSDGVLNVLNSGITASIDPKILMITTCGTTFDPTNVAYKQQTFGREILERDTIDYGDTYFFLEFSIDLDDDWQDPNVWAKSNPSLGHAVDVDLIKSELNEAQFSKTKRGEFLAKYCNRWDNSGDQKFLDLEDLNKAKAEINFEDLIEYPCWAGLDLATYRDISSLSYVFQVEDEYVIWTENYVPEGQFDKLQQQLVSTYNSLNKKHFHIQKQSATDHMEILNDFKSKVEEYNLDIQGFGYDPAAGGAQFVNSLNSDIPWIETVKVRQGCYLSEAITLFESLLLEGKIVFDVEDDCFLWCASCTHLAKNHTGLFQVIKEKGKDHYEKIDPLVATLCAFDLINNIEDSYYDNNDL